MAEQEKVTIDGKALKELRVVDLKKELDKRGLSKSGSKHQLMDRLKAQLLLEKLQQQPVSDQDGAPNISLQESAGTNSFIKQYLEQQKKLLESQREAKKKLEEEQALSAADTEDSQEEEEDSQTSTIEEVEQAESSPEKLRKPSEDQVPSSDVKEPQGGPSGDTAKTAEKTEEKQEETMATAEPPAPSGGRRKLRRNVSSESSDTPAPPVRRSRRGTSTNSTSTEEEAAKSDAKVAGDSGNKMTGVDEGVPAAPLSDGETGKCINKQTDERTTNDHTGKQTTDEGTDKQTTECSEADRQVDGRQMTKGDEEDKVEMKNDNATNRKSESQNEEEKVLSETNESKPKGKERCNDRIEVEPAAITVAHKEEQSGTVGVGGVVEAGQKEESGAMEVSEVMEVAEKEEGGAIEVGEVMEAQEKKVGEAMEVEDKGKGGTLEEEQSERTGKGTRSNEGEDKMEVEEKHEDTEGSGGTEKSVEPDKSSSGSKAGKQTSGNKKARSRSSSSSSSSSGSSRSRSRSSSASRSKSRSRSRSRSSSSSDSDDEGPSKVRGTVQVMQKKEEPGKESRDQEEKTEDVAMATAPAAESSKKSSEPGPTKEGMCTETEEPMEQSASETSDVSSSKKISLSSSMNKENQEKPARKRKWGSTRTNKKPSVNISTDSLKGLIPDIKPVASEATPDLDLSGEQATSETEDADVRNVKIKRTISQDVKPENGEVEDKRDEDGEKVQAEEDTRVVEQAEPVVARRISNRTPSIPIDEPKVARRSPTPSRHAVNKVIHVSNLVRPFTLGQLKEMLKKYGEITDDFWIDKIKSHCYATYTSEESAQEARKCLHNSRWPSSNPKMLRVDYATKDELEFHRNRDNGDTVKKEEPAKVDRRQAEREERRKEREAREARKSRDEAKPLREWDRDKLRQSASPPRKSRSRSRDRERRRRERSRERKERKEKEKKPVEEEEAPAKLLDDLFRKTKATPCIYWLPLTEDQVVVKQKERETRQKEREKRRQARQEEEEAERKKRAKEREERIKKRDEEERRERENRRRSRSRSRDRRR